MNASGGIVADGYYNIQFKIYQDGSGTAAGNPDGTLKWTETYINNGGNNGVQVKNGYFSVSLGSQTAFGSSVDWNQDTLWLSMNVAGSDTSCTTFGTAPCAADGEMISMKRLTSTPYAMNAARLGGLSSNQFIQSTTTPQQANIALQSSLAGSVGALLQGADGQTADILQVKANGVSDALLSVGATGSTTLRNSTDSESAFDVQNAAGASLLSVNTQANSVTLLGNNSGEVGTWQTASNTVPASLSDHVSVTANGYVYVMGAGNDIHYAKLNTDGSVGTWTTMSNALPADRYGATAVTANGYVYLLGGVSPNDDVYYAKLNSDGSVGTWKTANDLPEARGDATSVVANGYVYVIGGFNSVVKQSIFYAKLNADGSLGTWQTELTNTLPTTGRYRATSVYANGYVYVIGGPFGGTNVTFAKLNANGSVGAWTDLESNLPAIREDATSIAANGYVYVMGGSTNAVAGTSTVYYAKLNANGTLGSWSTALNPLPENRCRATSVMANGFAYVIGGNTGGSTDCANTTSETTVYYSRVGGVVQIGGSLDLVGAGGQTLADGGTGGQLTAGDTTIVGNMQVQGSANFTHGASVSGGLNVSGDGIAFHIQDSAGNSMLSVNADDLNGATNVQIGSGSGTGTPTMLTLDRAASAPTFANEEAMLGSMYYDTTLGKVQCFEDDGWGACGAAPDNFVTISPEYTNAVMNGTDIGTISSDLCSDALNINDSGAGTTVCGTNETYNFYKWTSGEAGAQTRGIYVTYQLPSTFKEFVAGSTSLMGRTDSANSSVTYEVYKDHPGSALAACGTAVSVSTGSQSTWQKGTAGGSADPSACGFVAGDSILIRINLSAHSNANAYVSTLGFTFSNN